MNHLRIFLAVCFSLALVGAAPTPAETAAEPGWRSIVDGELIWSGTNQVGDVASVAIDPYQVQIGWQGADGNQQNWSASWPGGERPAAIQVLGCGKLVTVLAQSPSGTIYQQQWQMPAALPCETWRAK